MEKTGINAHDLRRSRRSLPKVASLEPASETFMPDLNRAQRWGRTVGPVAAPIEQLEPRQLLADFAATISPEVSLSIR